MSAPGNCYQAAAGLLLSGGSGSTMRLVHGEVSGQGALRGVRYGHAWIEINSAVIDLSNGKSICLPRAAYYVLGQIEEDCVRRYSWREALQWMTRTGHYGPWEEALV